MRINEIFGPTVQGEGPALGEPCYFVRTANCNQHCVFCDTKYSWDWAHYERAKEERIMSVIAVGVELRNLAERQNMDTPRLVVISGGEPMMQQSEISALVSWLPEYAQGERWLFDLETAGTIRFPNAEAMMRFRNIVVSPKLASSGNELALRRRMDVLKLYADAPNTFFKFVIASEADVTESLELLNELHRRITDRVYFMPCGATREQLHHNAPFVLGVCERLGVRYTPRAHIEVFDAKRAV
jgi:7-carboxy-7-deazaguanine synthase